MSHAEKVSALSPTQAVAKELADILKGRDMSDLDEIADRPETHVQGFNLWGHKDFPKPPEYDPMTGYYAIDMRLTPELTAQHIHDAVDVLTQIAERKRTTGCDEVHKTLSGLSQLVADRLASLDKEIGHVEESKPYRDMYQPEIDLYKKQFDRLDVLVKEGQALGIFDEGQSFAGHARGSQAG